MTQNFHEDSYDIDGDLTQSLTLPGGPVESTKSTTIVLLVIIVIVIIGAGTAGVLLTGSTSHSTTTSTSVTNTAANSETSSTTTSSGGSTASSSQATSSASSGPFTISYDILNVGFQGGLWQIGFQSDSTKPISTLILSLSTPTPAIICSGFSTGLQFSNCLPGAQKGQYMPSQSPDAPFPLNMTFTGFSSGTGPGSATVGQSYSLTISATYTDGTTANETLSVQAIEG
jgi:hypothetical protein